MEPICFHRLTIGSTRAIANGSCRPLGVQQRENHDHHTDHSIATNHEATEQLAAEHALPRHASCRVRAERDDRKRVALLRGVRIMSQGQVYQRRQVSPDAEVFMSDKPQGALVYDWINKCYRWVVGGRVYHQRGDEHKRPIHAPQVVNKPKGKS